MHGDISSLNHSRQSRRWEPQEILNENAIFLLGTILSFAIGIPCVINRCQALLVQFYSAEEFKSKDCRCDGLVERHIDEGTKWLLPCCALNFLNLLFFSKKNPLALIRSCVKKLQRKLYQIFFETLNNLEILQQSARRLFRFGRRSLCFVSRIFRRVSNSTWKVFSFAWKWYITVLLHPVEEALPCFFKVVLHELRSGHYIWSHGIH